MEVLPRADPSAFLSSRKALIQVNESFGGLAPDVRQIEVLTGSGGGDCGIPFQPGEVYLVSAFLSKDGLVHAGLCSSTRRIESAGAVLRILRQRREGRTVPSLAGRIVQRERDFNGLLGTYPPKPLANTLVRLKSETRSHETRSDAEGIYAFYGLPPGRYEFAPELPQGTTLSWFIGSDRPQVPIELRGAGCHERDIEVFSGGSIQGRVVESPNNPLPHAFVYIVPADRPVLPKKPDLYWVSQGKEGHFKFVHIPPGRYLVYVNPEDSLDPDFPYPRTFHPGVHDRESATVITLGAGEQVQGADIRLQRQFAPRHVRVRVEWADGGAIRSFVYIVANGTSNPELESDASTDVKEPVGDLKLVPNESYEVHAELTCRYIDARSMGPGANFTSNKVRLKPGDGQEELTLTIPATACPEIQGKTLATDQ